MRNEYFYQCVPQGFNENIMIQVYGSDVVYVDFMQHWRCFVVLLSLFAGEHALRKSITEWVWNNLTEIGS